MVAESLGDAGGGGGCLPLNLLVVIFSLACFDGALAVIAFSQAIRIHLRSRQAGWTRQKVLHLMVGSSNFGYFIFFLGTVAAHCKRWRCWSRMCGFIFMAYPEILFLAAYLLLLSFWADLCHQENDDEDDTNNDDDNEENSTRHSLLDHTKTIKDSLNRERRWRCCSFQNVGSRQKFVIMVVAVVSVLMLSFAVVIWIGTGKNPIDSLSVSQVYVYLCAVTVLLLGGALSYYAALLFLKLRKIRSERAASEMWKVGGLAAVSLICFTSSALVALSSDAPLFYSWHLRKTKGIEVPALLIVYYFIGLSLPSSILLWVMRELPHPIRAPVQGEKRVIIFISYGAAVGHQPRQHAGATIATSQALRSSPI